MLQKAAFARGGEKTRLPGTQSPRQPCACWAGNLLLSWGWFDGEHSSPRLLPCACGSQVSATVLAGTKAFRHDVLWWFGSISSQLIHNPLWPGLSSRASCQHDGRGRASYAFPDSRSIFYLQFVVGWKKHASGLKCPRQLRHREAAVSARCAAAGGCPVCPQLR